MNPSRRKCCYLLTNLRQIYSCLLHPEVSQPNFVQIGNAAANLFIFTATGFILLLWYRDRYFLGMCTHERTSAIEGLVISFMHYLAYTWFMQAKFRPKGQK